LAVRRWRGLLTAGAQQSERMRRIGVLMNTAADNLDGQARFGAFLQGLQRLGWADGRNVRINIGWAGRIVATSKGLISTR
jgi:putative ABC transport system substrate-binding protein